MNSGKIRLDLIRTKPHSNDYLWETVKATSVRRFWTDKQNTVLRTSQEDKTTRWSDQLPIFINTHRIHVCYIWIYMVTWIPSIYHLYVSIYTSTMDPMGYSTSKLSFHWKLHGSTEFHRFPKRAVRNTRNSSYPDGRAITDEEIVGFLIAAFFGGALEAPKSSCLVHRIPCWRTMENWGLP